MIGVIAFCPLRDGCSSVRIDIRQPLIETFDLGINGKPNER